MVAISNDIPVMYPVAGMLSPCAGDGGNDVSMIQAANVGIGIEGKVCAYRVVCMCGVWCVVRCVVVCSEVCCEGYSEVCCEVCSDV